MANFAGNRGGSRGGAFKKEPQTTIGYRGTPKRKPSPRGSSQTAKNMFAVKSMAGKKHPDAFKEAVKRRLAKRKK